MKKILLLCCLIAAFLPLRADYLLVPMDYAQKEHLKAYGLAYWTLSYEVDVEWLLNYRGGSFLFKHTPRFEQEIQVRGISYELLSESKGAQLLAYVTSDDVNMDAVKLEKAPKVAVYSPKNKQPWDDAVTLALTYAEIPYDIVYDPEVLDGKLSDYDWLHLHHEDFTGQYGKFYANYRNVKWYQDEVKAQENTAKMYGYTKVSEMKSAVSKKIKQYCHDGGFLFAMCSATDTYDIALAAENVDICEYMFDGDPADPDAQSKLDYSKTLAFQNFELVKSPFQYEFSNIDANLGRKVPEHMDYFSLFEFSAKWDPVPTMLCQNHTRTVKGFMGQTTSFRKELLKPDVLVMGELKAYNEARYIHGNLGKGMWTYYGGHDPEDYRHFVGEDPTDLALHPSSPGYRLILNNILFPAARKKKRKT
ncbi:asparagine synthetase B [Pontibacter sp. G13]|uniref:asparagine synthetase B n=1 Tax=Pontibacter sp. G13 TaxID=3074898 RepID=UPI00288AFB32|nr:asparagine synthetase B [Pontibacter sp. G13]WNJ17550.1 asparagine synthetase B [Pontibacter sp. G13]